MRYRIYVTLLDTFGVGTSSLALGLVLLLAAGAMRDGRFTVGDFTLFAAYVVQATSAPRWLGRLLARKRTGRRGADADHHTARRRAGRGHHRPRAGRARASFRRAAAGGA